MITANLQNEKAKPFLNLPLSKQLDEDYLFLANL
jgi:hypothetical protein